MASQADESAINKAGGDGPMPLEAIAEGELLDHRDRMPIRSEQMVVELLDPHIACRIEARCQSAGKPFALDDRNALAASGEPQGKGEAQRAGSENGG